jgi:hypothetical protein
MQSRANLSPANWELTGKFESFLPAAQVKAAPGEHFMGKIDLFCRNKNREKQGIVGICGAPPSTG